MSTLTNKYGLPEALVRAVAYDDYDSGASDLTVTQLVSPPQLVELRRQHAHEIVEDAAERIWVLLGKIGHSILQRADIADALTEERLFTTVNGWRISGAFDRLILLPDETLQDWKITSVYATKDEVKSEWQCQTNVYAHLLRLHSFSPKKIEIVAILRDWRPSEAKRNPDWYPPVPVKVMPVELWSPESAAAYLEDRVLAHQYARGLDPNQLDPCTPEERWEQKGKAAVYRNANKTATRLFDTEDEATAFAYELAKDPKTKSTRIEMRPSVQARCQSYCPVNFACSQWAALKPAEPIVEDEVA